MGSEYDRKGISLNKTTQPVSFLLKQKKKRWIYLHYILRDGVELDILIMVIHLLAD